MGDISGTAVDFFKLIDGRKLGDDQGLYQNKRSIIFTLLSYVVIPILAGLFMLLMPLKAVINFVIRLFFLQNTHNMKGRIDANEELSRVSPHKKQNGTNNTDKNPNTNTAKSLLPSHSLRLQGLWIITLIVLLIFVYAFYTKK